MFFISPFCPELWYISNFTALYTSRQDLFPHLHNPVSRSSHNEALSGLKGGDVCDDVMMSHRQRLRAPSRGIITWSHLLLILNFLFSG